MIIARSILPIFLALFLIGCGAAQRTGGVINVHVSPQITVATNVRVNQGAMPESDILDFNDVRLSRVLEHLAVAMGHGVDFEFDVAMLPRPRRAFFERLLVNGLSALPDDAETLHRNNPELFAYASSLRHVVFNYDGSHSDSSVSFTHQTGVLTIRMGSGAWPIPTNSITEATGEAYDGYLIALFHSISEASISPAQYAGYFRYLTRLRSRIEQTARNRQPTHDLSNDPHSDTIARALRFVALLTNDPTLSARMRAWLIDQGEYYRSLYQLDPESLLQVPPTSQWSITERAFSAWMNSSIPSFSARELVEVFRNIPVVLFNRGAADDRYSRRAFPGFDVFALGINQLDRWIRASHRHPADADDDTGVRFASTACGGGENSDGRTFQHCTVPYEFEWLTYVMSTERDRARLIAYLNAHNDEAVTRLVIANVGSFESARWLWRGFESNESQWRAATLAMLNDYGMEQRDALLAEFTRLWREQPHRRDVELYGLLFLDQSAFSNDRPSIPWRDFSRSFGGLIDRATVEHALDLEQGIALDWISIAVPAIAPDVSVAELVFPRITHFPAPRGEFRRVDALIESLREAHRTGDLAFARTWLTARVSAHPSEDSWIQRVLERTR